ncbi:hypothetical protein BD626DRAFT_238104 [Schizophyllum amplum]|uniref:Uncharacterized protein n=1 Tax=Schizophyllum amplum TaxID=97359 RepID=A0A550CJK4_9AGAR|nr:hypothetical protein BD626DRAFT_238104 [Auriculariopsis ampla]
MTYKGGYPPVIPACLPELTLIHPMFFSMIYMGSRCYILFRPDAHNAQALAPQASRAAMQAIIDLAAHEQTLARALHDLLDALRQVLLPATERSLESCQDLIDEKCRVILHCLNESMKALNFTTAAFLALEHNINMLSRRWNTLDFRKLLPAIREMCKTVDVFTVQTADLRSCAERMPERFSISKLAEFCGDSEDKRRELDFSIEYADGSRVAALHKEAQTWRRVRGNFY